MSKKVVGIAFAVLGGMMFLSGLNLAFTKYDLKSSHDVSKLFGGLAIAVLLFASGVALIRRSGSKH
jgi:hypothetical protein